MSADDTYDDTYDDTMRYGHDYHLGGKITRPLGDILGGVSSLDPEPTEADVVRVVTLSEGKVITDPDEAEALGLTHAEMLQKLMDPWPPAAIEEANRILADYEADDAVWPQSGDCE